MLTGMKAKQPAPWAELATYRREVILARIYEEHPFYGDEEVMTYLVNSQVALEKHVNAMEIYGEMRAIARDLKIARPILKRQPHRSLGYQSMKKLIKLLTARLHHLEQKSLVDTSNAFAPPRWMGVGAGITEEELFLPDDVIEKIFPPLLAE